MAQVAFDQLTIPHYPIVARFAERLESLSRDDVSRKTERGETAGLIQAVLAATPDVAQRGFNQQGNTAFISPPVRGDEIAKPSKAYPDDRRFDIRGATLSSALELLTFTEQTRQLAELRDAVKVWSNESEQRGNRQLAFTALDVLGASLWTCEISDRVQRPKQTISLAELMTFRCVLSGAAAHRTWILPEFPRDWMPSASGLQPDPESIPWESAAFPDREMPSFCHPAGPLHSVAGQLLAGDFEPMPQDRAARAEARMRANTIAPGARFDAHD